MSVTNLKPVLQKIYDERLEDFKRLGTQGITESDLQRAAKVMKVTVEELKAQLEIETVEVATLSAGLRTAQTIVFSSEQAEVFRKVSQEYTESLDYTLPFSRTLLQFTKPISVVREKGQEDHVIALFLGQHVVDQEIVDRGRRLIEFGGGFGTHLETVEPQTPNDILNVIIIIYSDYNIRKIGWYSHDDKSIIFEKTSSDVLKALWHDMKNLAIACIGYINCENVILEKDKLPEKVLRKREKKGKTVEPYYVCRLRGSNGPTHATGNGSKQSYIYDVIGHFRHYRKQGFTRWIKPHKRGLANSIYIPKTYLVSDGVRRVKRKKE